MSNLVINNGFLKEITLNRLTISGRHREARREKRKQGKEGEREGEEEETERGERGRHSGGKDKIVRRVDREGKDSRLLTSFKLSPWVSNL